MTSSSSSSRLGSPSATSTISSSHSSTMTPSSPHAKRSRRLSSVSATTAAAASSSSPSTTTTTTTTTLPTNTISNNNNNPELQQCLQLIHQYISVHKQSMASSRDPSGGSTSNPKDASKPPSKLLKSYQNLIHNIPHYPNKHTAALFVSLYQMFYCSEKLMGLSLAYWDRFNENANLGRGLEEDSTGAAAPTQKAASGTNDSAAAAAAVPFKQLLSAEQKQLLLDMILKQLHSSNLTIKSFGLRFLLRFLFLLDAPLPQGVAKTPQNTVTHVTSADQNIRKQLIQKLSSHVLQVFKMYGMESGDAKGKFKLLNAMKNKMKEKELDEKQDLVQAALEVVWVLSREVDVAVAPFVAKITKRRESDLAAWAMRALYALTPRGGAPTFLLPLAPDLPDFERICSPSSSGGAAPASASLIAFNNPNTLAAEEIIASQYVHQTKQKRHKKEELYPKMNIEHEDARKSFSQLCTAILPPLPRDWKGKGEQPYELKRYPKPELQSWLKGLYCMFHDAQHSVFLSVLSVAPRKNWALFLEEDPVQKGSKVPLCKFVIERLCLLLQQEEYDTNMTLAATRAAQCFISGFIIFRSRFPRQITDTIEEYMYSLWNTLSLLHSSPDDEIRLKAYKVSLWHTRQVHIVVDQLKMEIQGNRTWSALKLHELGVSLQQHSFIHKEVFDSLEDFYRYLCIQYSSRMDISLFISLCKNQLREERVRIFGSRVLKLLYYVMDSCMDGSKVAQHLIMSIVDFLGEYANSICDEPTGTQPADKSNGAAPPSLKKPVINENPQIFDDAHGKPSNKDIFFRPETFDVQNPAMKSIIARLMKCATYSSTVIRVNAVKALAKIAFRSLDPIRLYIYQCLVYLEQSPIFGVNSQCAHIVSVLDQLYEVNESFYHLVTAAEAPVMEEMSRFAREHQMVREKIQFYCTFPKDWLPLGEDSRDLVQAAQSSVLSREIESTAKTIEDMERELAG